MNELEFSKAKLEKLWFAKKTWTPITKKKKGKITNSKFCGKFKQKTTFNSVGYDAFGVHFGGGCPRIIW